jgi:hypothetical protein
MKDFAQIFGGEQGSGKSLAEIRATTGKAERPANWKPNQKLPEWERSETLLKRDEFIRRCEPTLDRILVQVLPKEERPIILTDKQGLIGGECRKAIVLKTGPGKWIPGQWWNSPRMGYHRYPGIGTAVSEALNQPLERQWEWIPGYCRPVSVVPGQTVAIGNWTDLELDDIALCGELDVRAICQS